MDLINKIMILSRFNNKSSFLPQFFQFQQKHTTQSLKHSLIKFYFLHKEELQFQFFGLKNSYKL
jgi:hypothetical protein